MAKNSVSEWSTVSSGNGDIAGITLGLDMPPSYVNNAMQEMMAQIKQWKDGYIDPDTGLPVYQSLTVNNIDIEGNANFKGGMKLDGSYGTYGQVLVSSGSSATPTWGNAFFRGMIMMWSGSTSSVPDGWRLCDGGGGTPDLRNRFVVGAGSSYAVNATGGSANAVVVTHTHPLSGSTSSAGAKTLTASTSVSVAVGTKSQSGYFDTINRGGTSYNNPIVRRGAGTVSVSNKGNSMSFGEGWEGEGGSGGTRTTIDTSHNHTATASASTSVSAVPNHVHTLSGNTGGASSGVSGTNKNLPPYYALAYIMKA